MIQEPCSKDLHEEEKPRVWVAVGGCGKLRSKELVFKLGKMGAYLQAKAWVPAAESRNTSSAEPGGVWVCARVGSAGEWGLGDSINNSQFIFCHVPRWKLNSVMMASGIASSQSAF